MSHVTDWEGQKDFLSNKLYWREIDTGIHLGGLVFTKSVLQKTHSSVAVAIRNEKNNPITANVYIGIDPKNKIDCSKTTTEVIDLGQVWFQIFNIPIKTRKENKLGEHMMGLYIELRNAKRIAKKVAGLALSVAVGIKVGKIHGMGLKFKVVEANTYKCLDCNKFLVYRTIRKNSKVLQWVCESCQRHWNV